MPNPTGIGLRPNKKGERRGGRKAGTPNKFTTSLKDDTLGAAEDVGMIEEHKIVDKDGKETGGTRLLATGKDGRRGYLRWAAIHQPASFIGLLARFIPAELNVKTETMVTVSYETVEETREALIERGIDPDALEQAMKPAFLLEHHKEPAE